MDKIKKCSKRYILFIFFFLGMLFMNAPDIMSVGINDTLEIVDDNWNISLTLYDKSNSSQGIIVNDFLWNVENSDEKKSIVMQINYACTTGKKYNPGDIVIQIPGIGKESFSEYWRNKVDYMGASYYNNWLSSNVAVAADKKSNTQKQYDWSYEYDTKNNIYVFTNNEVMEQNEHFEGTIQIAYNLEPNFKINTNLEFQASMKENISSDNVISMKSNICKFTYTSKKINYYLDRSGISGIRADYSKVYENPEEYYWVEYTFKSINETGVIKALDYDSNEIGKSDVLTQNANCIIEELPEDCIMYDYNMERLEPIHDNTYLIYDGEYLYNGSISLKKYYVGYPKNKYSNGEKVTNKAEVWGRYEDETEFQKLAENIISVGLVDIDFVYTGELYWIDKKWYNSVDYFLYDTLVKKSGNECGWQIGATAIYTGNLLDVEIGDDLIYITRENGDITRLNDDEYNFTKIMVPIFYTYNKYSGSIGDSLIGYNYDLMVRYKDSMEYTIYKAGVTSDKAETIVFGRNDVVGVKLIIKNLDRSIFSTSSKGLINIFTNIHTKDCIDGGYVYNFDCLQVYKVGENGQRILQNEPTLESYKTPESLGIDEYDMKTYGTYMQRSYAENKINKGYFSLSSTKYIPENIVNDVENEKYIVNYKIGSNISLYYNEVDRKAVIKTYDILPEGMYLDCNENDIVSNTSLNYFLENLKTKDGLKIDSMEKLLNCINKDKTVDIDYNYKGSGRTKIEITYDLNNIDFSYYINSNFSKLCIYSNIYVKIPYDSILEYGTQYTNYVYSMWENQEYTYLRSTSYNADGCDSYGNDNGIFDKLANDIDNDGNNKENLVYSYTNLNIIHAVSSHQSVVKLVSTSYTKGEYVKDIAKTAPGEEYEYKLRVTTGSNGIKDLIIYDTLETIYDKNGDEINCGFKGEFLGVDTSYAILKGYAPIVYYSEEKNPGKLTEVSEKWKLLTNDADTTMVKSICVDLRKNSDGDEYRLSANSAVFVLIKMKAPNGDYNFSTTSNMFNTTWKAIDTNGIVIDNLDGIYSNQVGVEVSKENIRASISGLKTWDDEGNKYGLRPESITIRLLQDGKEYLVTSTSANKNWKYSFENIPLYKDNTLMYEYTLKEDMVPNYNPIYNGYDIENKLELVDIEAVKLWEDNDNIALKRPESIILQLKNKDTILEEKIVDKTNDWKYTFKNLPKYDNLGNEIIYTIDEKDTSKFYIKELVGNTTIINKFKVPDEIIELEVIKKWEDNNNVNGKRADSVTLQVKKNNEIVVEAKVSENDEWKHTFILQKYDELGNEIKYTVDEKEVDSLFYIKNIVGNIITNRFVIPEERIKIIGTKVWQDNDNIANKRDISIVLQVKVNDKVISEAEVNSSTNWKYEFELAKYDEFGNEIRYELDEKEIENKFYQKIKVENEDMLNQKIINKFIVPDEFILVNVIKKWEDNNNEYKKRPGSVILQVKLEEKVVAEAEVSDKTNWSYEFKLPKYDEFGNEINYTVDEKNTPNYYEKSIDGKIIINKCIFEESVNTSDINIIKYVLIIIISVLLIILAVIIINKDKNSSCLK